MHIKNTSTNQGPKTTCLQCLSLPSSTPKYFYCIAGCCVFIFFFFVLSDFVGIDSHTHTHFLLQSVSLEKGTFPALFCKSIIRYVSSSIHEAWKAGLIKRLKLLFQQSRSLPFVFSLDQPSSPSPIVYFAGVYS